MEFLAQYGLFLAKAVTIVVAILVVLGGAVALGSRQKRQPGQGHLEVTKLNDKLDQMKQKLEASILPKEALKKRLKQEKKEKAKQEKQKAEQPELLEKDERKRFYVLEFEGDLRASKVSTLREAITSVLAIARPNDEVVVKLESPGGMVHAYGLAASQLQRIRDRGIPLTVCVDKVAASGGYMMACIADRILAAPFAVIGSIGVVAQIPNFHRLLKKHDIDYEVMTAGEYKRTMTIFGENTEKGREKFLQDLEDTHVLFKEFVAEHRPQVDIDEVSKGEVWYGRRALDQKLVDGVMTSDEYLFQACEQADVYLVSYVERKSLQQRFAMAAEGASERLLMRLWEGLQDSRLFKHSR